MIMLFPMNAGGGKLEETVLWANSSPSSNFDAQTITLSDDIDNYDFVKIQYRIKTSENVYSDVIIPVSDLKNNVDANNHPLLFTGGREASRVWWARKVEYVSDTQLSFTTAYRVNASGTDATSLMVPIKVIGIKQTSGGGTIDPPALVDTVLWTNSSPSSAMSETTVTLSDDVDNYDFIKIRYKEAINSDSKVSEVMASVADFKKSVVTDNNAPLLSVANLNSDKTLIFVRRLLYISDTSAKITNAYSLNAVNTNNNSTIPLQIIGVKKTSAPTKYVYKGAPPANGRIECGFQPKTITIIDPNYVSGSYRLTCWYDADYSTSVTNSMLSGTFYQDVAIGSNSNINLVDNTGFNLTSAYLNNFSSYLYILATA